MKILLDEAYKTAVAVIRESREDMDKVVAYLLEKETITGGEMVAIIEGRDPALAESPYASTRPAEIEAPAKKVHMISEKITAPEEPPAEAPDPVPETEPAPETPPAPQADPAPAEAAPETEPAPETAPAPEAPDPGRKETRHDS